MQLPSYVLKALHLLEQNGFQAVVVGGAVRDFWLGKEPGDYDISTSATPDETVKVFMDYFVLDFGRKHGTITVFLDHHMLEITTFRVESGYDDFRHPNQTEFVRNLERDVSRRDFTINAICFNQQYFDFVNGMEDLKNGIIRAIGNPRDRFLEDPLRMMRGLRFASVLGFSIEEKTRQALIDLLPLILQVSKERIRDELNRFLMGNDCSVIFSEYGEKLLSIISPTIAFDYPAIIRRLEVAKGLYAKIAAIFLDSSYESLKNELKSLKYSNDDQKKVFMFWEAQHLAWKADRYFLAKLLSQYSFADVVAMIEFEQSLPSTSISPLVAKEMIEILSDLNLHHHCFKIADLAIKGQHLMQLGIPQGKRMKMILSKLLDEIMQGILVNEEAVLLARAKALYQERRKHE